MIYLVERTDNYGWDETISVVVEANSVDHAREVAKGTSGDQSVSVWDTAEVTLLALDAAAGVARGAILHASFRAG